jgi:hypothetical protein
VVKAPRIVIPRPPAPPDRRPLRPPGRDGVDVCGVLLLGPRKQIAGDLPERRALRGCRDPPDVADLEVLVATSPAQWLDLQPLNGA